MFNKSLSQLNEDDILALVENKERESSILEFKQEITGSDHEKKKFLKIFQRWPIQKAVL